jgi:hypothetical protein
VKATKDKTLEEEVKEFKEKKQEYTDFFFS